MQDELLAFINSCLYQYPIYYCAGNPINYTDPSGHAIWEIIGAAMGAYDGYKYAKKKKLTGWKKAAAIVGGATLGAVNPFKVVKAAKKVYKAAKYVKSARSTYKKAKSIKKIAKKTKVTKVKVKKYNVKKGKPTKKKKYKKTLVKNKKKATGKCFVAGTKISTENGCTPIEKIKPGDHVWSENPETNEKALKKVNKIFVREKDSIIRLSINGEIIETTDEHPFYVENKGFVGAGELETGDEVRLQSGGTATVDSAEKVQLEQPIKVYNFEVEDFHTYYVSEQQVLVHNTCNKTTAKSKTKSEKTYSPITERGPLSDQVADSFRTSTYTEKVLDEDTVFYRVYGGDAEKVGSYMSRTPQNGGIQSQMDLALNPEWNNTATNVTRVIVPKGTTIYEGVAAPQTINGGAGRLPGGGNQIFIERGVLKTKWFVD